MRIQSSWAGRLATWILVIACGLASACDTPTEATTSGGVALDETGASTGSTGESMSLCELISTSSGVGVYVVSSITSKIEKDTSLTVADGQVRPKTYVHYVSGEELAGSAPPDFIAKTDGGVHEDGSISLPAFGAKLGETVVVFLPEEDLADGTVHGLHSERLFRDRGDGGFTNDVIFGVEKHTLADVRSAIAAAVGSNTGSCVDVLPDGEAGPSEPQPEEAPHEVQGTPAED
jgi:hypothetical protein